MNERDEQILRHIGRYRISIRAVIERLYFRGATSDHVLRRLSEESRICVHKGVIPGGLSYYQLTLRETRRLGLPDTRARQDKTKVLRRELAVLWFCCMADRERLRLDHAEFKRLGPAKIWAAPHIAETSGPDTFIYRLYMPSPGTKDDRFIDILRADAFDAVHDVLIAGWTSAGRYGFAVLVENRCRETQLTRLIERRHFPDLTIHVQTVPTFELLHSAINECKERGA